MSIRVMDRAEQILWIVIYSFFCYRFLLPLLQRLASDEFVMSDMAATDIAYVVDQTIVILFMLIRRSAKDLSFRVSDWLAAIVGTALPLMLTPNGPEPLVPERIALFLIVLGTAFHIYAKLTLRRSFGAVPAIRVIKFEGPYRLVRHPMYLGYMISQLGIVLAIPNPFNIAVIALNWCVQIWRIHNEEAHLMQDESYAAMAKKVRYRLLPGLY